MSLCTGLNMFDLKWEWQVEVMLQVAVTSIFVLKIKVADTYKMPHISRSMHFDFMASLMIKLVLLMGEIHVGRNHQGTPPYKV
jgi:hypothetical protein